VQKIWPDTKTCSATISSCAHSGCWEQALQLLYECKTWATLDNISYSVAITSCEKGGQHQYAVALLKAMSIQKIWPDTAACSATISACAQGKCWERALQLLEDCNSWATLDNISYNATITACEKGGQWQHAAILLKTMWVQKIWPDTTTYSASISACAHGKCWELALQLLEDCTTWATLDNISYNATITACEKGGQWQHAIAL